ncbi:MAG TPA: DUF2332 domain-containing protein [Streptosporangiaceae bacterium]|nr:DUF2332 domain-containing protein [Streptosporangiaceae bacterium]
MNREQLADAFRDPTEFVTSPLYRALSRAVAADDGLLDLAGRGRPGQYPTFLFFGAVHHLLLGGAGHPLARFYPSLAGSRALSPDDPAAGQALVSFCREFEPELTKTISTRLVQTNQVQRALALRFGLAAIAAEIPAPAYLIEVGTSAGLNLRFDRYGYHVGGRHFGDPGSPVQLTASLHGSAPLPDLDALPEIASVLGVDLSPVDVLDPDARSWLEALVWPENHRQRAQLAAACAVAAADPPPIRAGDAIDVLPRIAASLPPGAPRVVFHSATRMHVPAGRLAAFDAAIAGLGTAGPLWWLSLESTADPDPRPEAARQARPGAGLVLRRAGVAGRDDASEVIAVVDGHLGWLETAPRQARTAAT